MRFSWDPEKARTNPRKHGIRFENATRVFGDTIAEWREDDPVNGEERWQRIGFVDDHHFVVVAYRLGSTMTAVKSSASSRRATPKAGSGAGMSEDEVVFELDVDNPPPLTPEEGAEIQANAPKADADIDFSDIRRLTEEWFARARRGPYRPHKQQLTLGLDVPVVDWFKRHAEGGKGYQTAINRALRDYVAAQVKAGRR